MALRRRSRVGELDRSPRSFCLRTTASWTRCSCRAVVRASSAACLSSSLLPLFCSDMCILTTSATLF
eukprot:CAMPEP_0206232236 /NCGR_PEP_ID=MMETSP0047_2-20121206/11304_1 /ASSEMBLY_ACC=CAM_ASM_000192 /TAXON_ID=195065 /ORGANISM="Chroomonas mesostigmatica_cf, Strain CCMP1168" /LENGTH=66 /DNA_ID=CAMNT_0053655951 /DNA_START=309 /DNA_END=509 /DNA_ORIENTATION=-